MQPTEQATQPKEQTESQLEAQKKLVEQLKSQWKQLWSERFNDKIKAEDVSINDYTALSVEKGTIIHATRDFKALNFKEILAQNRIDEPDRFVQPDAHTGGWTKFVKNNIATDQRHRRAQEYAPKKPQNQQPKKGGRGWLHAT